MVTTYCWALCWVLHSQFIHLVLLINLWTGCSNLHSTKEEIDLETQSNLPRVTQWVIIRTRIRSSVSLTSKPTCALDRWGVSGHSTLNIPLIHSMSLLINNNVKFLYKLISPRHQSKQFISIDLFNTWQLFKVSFLWGYHPHITEEETEALEVNLPSGTQ